MEPVQSNDHQTVYFDTIQAPAISSTSAITKYEENPKKKGPNLTHNINVVTDMAG